MTTETIITDGEVQEVETKPITLICHRDNIKIEIPSRVEIGPEQTVRRADALTEDEWDELRGIDQFLYMWHCVFPDNDPPVTIKGEGLGYRHVIGLIVLLVETIHAKKKPFIKLPESYLHPSAQCGLADLFIYISNKKA